MTIYDDMRGYVHTHDCNGLFDVVAETTPMYQMIDKADAENAKLRKYVRMCAKMVWDVGCDRCPYRDPDLCDTETAPMSDGCRLWEEMREFGIEVGDVN